MPDRDARSGARGDAPWYVPGTCVGKRMVVRQRLFPTRTSFFSSSVAVKLLLFRAIVWNPQGTIQLRNSCPLVFWIVDLFVGCDRLISIWLNSGDPDAKQCTIRLTVRCNMQDENALGEGTPPIRGDQYSQIRDARS